MTTEIIIGKPIVASTSGNFPGLGSRLGPFFCLGRLGKGTFCSIHKCIQLHYYQRQHQQQQHHPHSSSLSSSSTPPPSPMTTIPRIVAAKVELDTFQNSGVLDGEAIMLQHLDLSLPPGTVPKYMGYYKTSSANAYNDPSHQQQQQQQQSSSSYSSPTCSAIVMEYMPGEDMHQLRDRVVFGRPSRRIALEDAVYLTADVMLPLLQRMHQVGIVHRDVKPSNVVRCGNAGTDRRFCMVDFGLSKSLVVPHDSPLVDDQHVWYGTSWIRPPPTTQSQTTTTTTTQSQATTTTTSSNPMVTNSQLELLPTFPSQNGVGQQQQQQQPAAASNSSSSIMGPPPPPPTTTTTTNTTNTAYFRKERPVADFRGTSMYASLRVHQSKDYCPRDDMWSLLYVFCDLVSGGLPWMSHAANRDRDACQKLKELVHGEEIANMTMTTTTTMMMMTTTTINPTTTTATINPTTINPTTTNYNYYTNMNRHEPNNHEKEKEEGEEEPNNADNYNNNDNDQTHQLLMGDLYHLAKFKRDHHGGRGKSGGGSSGGSGSGSGGGGSSDAANEISLPEPLAMSKDVRKVQLLRKAFAHLATLQFWDIPNYDLIQQCIHGFLPDASTSTSSTSTTTTTATPADDPIAPISWEHFPSTNKSSSSSSNRLSSSYRRSESMSTSTSTLLLRKRVPTWDFTASSSSSSSCEAPLDEDLFDETEAAAAAASANDAGGGGGGDSSSSHPPLEGDEADMARLPLEFRYRLAQMEFNTFRCSSCPLHLALRDFMNVALPLLYGEWDCRTFERGNHRTNSDGYRREVYLKCLDKCLKCAECFGNFTDSSWLLYDDNYEGDDDDVYHDVNHEGDDDDGAADAKERGVQQQQEQQQRGEEQQQHQRGTTTLTTNETTAMSDATSRPRPSKRRRTIVASSTTSLLSSSTTSSRSDSRLESSSSSNNRSSNRSSNRGNELLTVAKVLVGLEISKAIEEKKNLAPPPRLSFGGGFGMM